MVIKMKKHRFDVEILDTDIMVKQMKERLTSQTWEYHNNLLTMMDMKRTGDGEGGKELNRLMMETMDNFGSIVSIQRSMIEMSLEMCKKQLQRAFELSGLDMSKLVDGINKEKEDE